MFIRYYSYTTCVYQLSYEISKYEPTGKSTNVCFYCDYFCCIYIYVYVTFIGSLVEINSGRVEI